MANIAQSVNVISPLMTTKDGLVKQTIWWPLLLFSKYMRGWTIGTHVSCSTYDGTTVPSWMQSTVDSPFLDVSATIDDDGYVSMVVVNVHETDNYEIDVEGLTAKAGKVQKYVITGKEWDVTNTQNEQNVDIEEHEWDGRGKCAFQRLSMTMLRWQSR